MQDFGFIRDVFLKKQLILDTCEPFIEKKEVSIRKKKSFNMCCFGKFEIGGSEFIYGAEENSYNSIFNDKSATQFPIIFAKIKHTPKNDTFYELAPKGDFSETDIDAIVECINHTLEEKRVIRHYVPRCFD